MEDKRTNQEDRKHTHQVDGRHIFMAEPVDEGKIIGDDLMPHRTVPVQRVVVHR